MFAAYCFRQGTYVAQGHVNVTVNETRTHSCLWVECFPVLYGFIEVSPPFTFLSVYLCVFSPNWSLGLVWFLCLMAYQLFFMLFNAKAILLEEQYYLTHSWEDKGVHTFPKGICPKVNIIARLENELAYYDSAVHRFNHYTTRTPPQLFLIFDML